MARKPTGTAVANYDEELAKYATAAADKAPTGEGGKFITLRAGVMSFDDAPLPGNQMMAIVIAHCLENVYYEGKFDPDNRTPPTCFAFSKIGDDTDEMGPPAIVDELDVFERQSDLCHGCPKNEWGSADTGRGKACGNRRRLALLPAGTYKPAGRGAFDLELFEEPEHYQKAEPAYLKVPVTSGKGFDTYVKQLSEQFRKPAFAVFTRISAVPDPKSQFKLNFEMESEVPNELLAVLIARHKEIDKGIDFPYTPMAEEAAPAAKPANKKLGGRAPARARK